MNTIYHTQSDGLKVITIIAAFTAIFCLIALAIV